VEFERDSTLSSIGEAAFVNCCSLLAIHIPSSVERIAKRGFSGCASLVTATFESGSKLSCLEELAFALCSRLESFSIPSSVERLSSKCFRGCQSLSIISFESGARLARIEPFCLTGYLSRERVAALGVKCFEGCESLSVVRFDWGSQLPYVPGDALARRPPSSSPTRRRNGRGRGKLIMPRMKRSHLL
jgi:hypothetical protein